MSIVRTWQTENGDVVEVFVGADDQHHWRVKDPGNHEIVGRGEGHPRLADAVVAAERHHPPVASDG